MTSSGFVYLSSLHSVHESSCYLYVSGLVFGTQ